MPSFDETFVLYIRPSLQLWLDCMCCLGGAGQWLAKFLAMWSGPFAQVRYYSEKNQGVMGFCLAGGKNRVTSEESCVPSPDY